MIFDIYKDLLGDKYDFVILSISYCIFTFISCILLLFSQQFSYPYDYPNASFHSNMKWNGYTYDYKDVSQDGSQPNSKALSYESEDSLLGIFYYIWYGHWNHWKTDDHNPPKTWNSNYLPDIIPNEFKPAEELYDSANISIVAKHLKYLSKSGIQFGIVSWWGKDSHSDDVFHKILSSGVTKSNYPSFKWALLYENEGYKDPSVGQIFRDLEYIRSKYTHSPDYLKINGKPVIFVYNAGHAGYDAIDDYNRWKEVRDRTDFFVVLKVDPLAYGADPSGIDSWYQYAPSKRYDVQENWSAMVSPGFWKYHENPKLERNLTDFELAVQNLSNAKVQFKLIETFNEWGEGTGIEPATTINHDDKNGFTSKNNGYGTSYLDIIGRYFNK